MDEPIKNTDLTPEEETALEDSIPADEPAEEDDPLANAFQYDQPDPPKVRRWPIIVLAVLLAAVFVAGLLWAFGVFDSKAPADDAPSFGTADVSDLTAAQSANFTVTNGMFAFHMETTYWNYYSSLGLDPSLPLKEQAVPEGEGTWFDFFADNTKKDMQWMLTMSELARTTGITLPKDTADQIAADVATADVSQYHNGVSKEDMQAFLTMYHTALAQENALYSSIRYTAEEVEAYYQKNASQFQVCDFVYFGFSFGEGKEFATAEEAKAAAKKLADCKTAEEFKSAIITHLLETEQFDDREQAAEAVDLYCHRKGAAYAANDGISDWLFAADTAVGSTKTVNGDTSVIVYMLTKAPGRNTASTVNVRHILLSEDTYGSDEAAKQKADEILNTWKSGEATADSFGALAKEFSEDSSSELGGLIEGVTEGQMVEAFNDWCFDTTRRIGDSGIVKTEYGYHVMYFDGTQEMWYTTVLEQMKNEAHQAKCDELAKQYPVTFFDENINKNEI